MPMLKSTRNVDHLVFLGTATKYAPIADDSYDYGETLSILTVLLSQDELEKKEGTVEPISQKQIHLIEGPNNLGTEVGDRIARGIFRVLDSVLENDTQEFNILAHSRGAVQAILLTHEIKRIQELCEKDLCTV